MTMSGGSGTGTGGGSPASTTVLPTVTGHTVVEVTFPRRNTDAGLAAYSIKSETYDPRSSKY
jgi:hypothetical protein